MQARLAAGFRVLFFPVLSFLVLSTMALPGQAQVAASDTTVPVMQGATRTIVVSLEDRRLALLEDGVVKKVYRIAVGKDATPSPTGTFTIVDRVTNPTYYHAGTVIPPGPGNPVGTRWMGLSAKGYGIHGTNEPRSIGRAASHGCIRMGRHDLEDLFAQVRSGDGVEIVGERDAETAAIFGMPAVPGIQPATTVLAKAEPGSVDRPADVAAAAEMPAA
ncbi:MAG TPA: L,D-transpeptidase, partial [Acidobacteriaceae bacterium]